MSVVIVDYGSGNLHSAAKAFERANEEAGLKNQIIVSANPEVVRRAERIVLPGVGAFADCRRGLHAVDGMIEVLDEAVHKDKKPFLGICVGMQLLATRGLEYEISEGLNWISGSVKRIEPNDPSLKIPHMGWNTLWHNLHGRDMRPHKLFDGILAGEDGWHAYFVHSFHFAADNEDDIVAVTQYGGPITAAVARGNIAGTQFHPEKSQMLGLRFIANFLRWQP
ncbi:imidazole glycerol phosphate synthase subunit HisH [Microvirga sp. W0021]|uniref:Imidazole glycerol phosphate synthase subunit HisH n=1 Tax=Hohaiivirga grylli TaxID=3133970 RepID=A0ABV0BFD6_9HYPH